MSMEQFVISGFADEIDDDFERQLAHLERLGIRYLEIRSVNGVNIANISDEQLAMVQTMLHEKNIQVSAIGSPCGKDRIDEDFAPQLARLERIVYIAKKLQTKYVRMFSFYCDGRQDDATKAEVIRRLKCFVAVAEREGIILLHENESDIFGESAENCKALFDAIVSPYFSGIFDPANFVVCHEDTLAAIDLLLPHITYLHIKDATQEGEIVPAGCGIGNVKKILKKLAGNGFSGFLSIEPHLGNYNPAGTDGAAGSLLQSGPEKFTLAYNTLMDILERI